MRTTKYMADFETTTKEDDCRVWAYGFVEIGHEDVQIGNSLDEFMHLILSESSVVYFHNLKFDGDFILVWLYENGYSLTKTTKNMIPFEFTTMISDKGQFYSITVQQEKHRVVFRDSQKIINMGVKKAGRGFGLEVRKGEIDYDLERPIGWEITQEEKDYIRNDVLIIAKVLETLWSEDLKANTQASNALQDYRKSIDKQHFQRYFPPIPIWKDSELRTSYKGGFTWANKRFTNKEIGPGIVLDKNSMYPWVMRTKYLPYGIPEYFEGEYEHDSLFPLYIQRIKCNFRLKEGYIPTIQDKNPGPWSQVEYLESSLVYDKKEKEYKEVQFTLTLTSVDLKLFLEHYDVFNLEYIDGYKFRQTLNLFTNYIDKWYERKEQASKNKNKAQKQLAKLMLNSLYGKFGTSPQARNKWPYYDNGRIKYVNDKEDSEKKTLYIPVASFITSYSREECIRSAQKCFDRILYCDTDSLHLIGTELPDLDVDPYRLGAWKCEGVFKRGKYLRAKSYVEEMLGHKVWDDIEDIWVYDDLEQEEIFKVLHGESIENLDAEEYLKVTCAGLPESCHKEVTFENFKVGAVYKGKLTPRHVKGGTVLLPTTFEIKG